LERDFKGVWIAKEIWLDNKLTWMEKLFITEINSLDKENGCFASNNYFAEFFQISPGRCSQIINSIIKKGYMSVEYIREGKEIKKRVLRILNTPIKNSKGGIKNTKDEYLGNDKDNNILINNTNNKVTKENSPHHKLINYIGTKYKEITGNKMFWNKRYFKDIDDIRKFASEEEIYNRLKILEEKVKENKSSFWTYTPNKLKDNWNELIIIKKETAEEQFKRLGIK